MNYGYAVIIRSTQKNTFFYFPPFLVLKLCNFVLENKNKFFVGLPIGQYQSPLCCSGWAGQSAQDERFSGSLSLFLLFLRYVRPKDMM